MRTPRRLLLTVLAGVLAIAAAGWAVSTRLRSPADEAALRTPPRPSLVTAPVERTKLVSTVAASGTLEYGSPYPVTLAGAVGGDDERQRVTRPPRTGTLKEGAVLMEVNGRPVITLAGKVPMHRTIAPGAEGDDVKQVQRALRRLGSGPAVTGVFDQATVAAVARLYAAKGYEAQRPTLEARQQLGTLRRAVRTAQETLATERKALDDGSDVKALKTTAANAKADLKAAQAALEDAGSRAATPEDAAKLDAAEAAVRSAEEKLLEAGQALAQARNPQPTPTSQVNQVTQDSRADLAEATPNQVIPAQVISARGAPVQAAPAQVTQPSGGPQDTRLLELRVADAGQDLDSARRALGRVREDAGTARDQRLTVLRKAARDAQAALDTAEQALRQARNLSPTRLKVTDATADLAEARSLLAEYTRTYGTTIPPGELVFLPKLPARVSKAQAKAGDLVEKAVATVTSSSFVVAASVEAAEAGLLKEGMKAVIETDSGKSYPATLTAMGEKADLAAADQPLEQDPGQGPAAEPVLVTPDSAKGLAGLSGAAVTARVTVGETAGEVLAVPVAAVITAADGRARVRVEVAPDRTKDVEVRTGLTANGKVQVTADLRPGDRVVITGA